MPELSGGQQQLYAEITEDLLARGWRVTDNLDGSLTVFGDEGGPWHVEVQDVTTGTG